MQTKHDIMRILTEAELLPVRGPGQNFLFDGNVLRKIASLGELSGQDVALEVGTGTGALTELLAGEARHVFTVDIDSRLQQAAARELAVLQNITFIRADVLQSKRVLSQAVLQPVMEAVERAPSSRLKIVSNLPYNIATPFILNVLESPLPVELMVVTVQREVAERLASSSGNAHYGAVSVIAQTLADVKIVHYLSPNVFWPKPKVSSAVLRLRPKSAAERASFNLAPLKIILEILFQQRRKKALGTARQRLGKKEFTHFEAVFRERGLNPDLRPQDLTVIDFLRLAQYDFVQDKEK